MESDPWTVSLYASQKQDLDLGRRVITCFGDSADCPSNQINQLEAEEMEVLKPTWLVDLLRARFRQREVYVVERGVSARVQGGVLRDWKHVALRCSEVE